MRVFSRGVGNPLVVLFSAFCQPVARLFLYSPKRRVASSDTGSPAQRFKVATET